MDNVIYKEGPIQVQVTYLDVYQDKVYAVLKLQNDGGTDVQFINKNHYSSTPEYRSKKLGIKRFLGIIPSSDMYMKISAGYFLEIQAVFDCPAINEGDEFTLSGYFDLSFRGIVFSFMYQDDQWVVITKLAGGKNYNEESFQTLLEFPKKK